MMQHGEHNESIGSARDGSSSAKDSKTPSNLSQITKSIFSSSAVHPSSGVRPEVMRIDKDEVSRLFCSQVVTAGLQQMKIMRKSKSYNTQSLTPDDFSTIGGGDDILSRFVKAGMYYDDEVILKFPGSPYDDFLQDLRRKM